MPFQIQRDSSHPVMSIFLSHSSSRKWLSEVPLRQSPRKLRLLKCHLLNIIWEVITCIFPAKSALHLCEKIGHLLAKNSEHLGTFLNNNNNNGYNSLRKVVSSRDLTKMAASIVCLLWLQLFLMNSKLHIHLSTV